MQLLALIISACWLRTCLTSAQQLGQQIPLQASDTLQHHSASIGVPKTELVEVYKKLLSYDSVTGKEKEIGFYLRELLRRKKFHVELQEVEHDRFNVYAWPESMEEKEARMLLTSHMDVVPPFIPYSITYPENLDAGQKVPTFWGRGTVDAKASIAAQIVAALNVLPEHNQLALLFVIGEETHGKGMRHFSSHASHNFSAVIFGEPTEGKLACGHKGIMGLSIRASGKAAHSGYPWLGVSANDILLDGLSLLKVLESDLPHSEKYGKTTLNIGRLDGGAASNVVAENAMADITIRLADGQPIAVQDQILRGLSPAMERAHGKGGNLELEWSENRYAPVDIKCDVKGFETTTVNYGTDVPNLAGTHDRYLYGPGSILLAHGPDEHLTQDDLEEAAVAYEQLLRHAMANI